MRIVLSVLLFITLTGAGFAAAQSAEVRTVTIGPGRVECTGLVPQKCLQVKEKAGDPYTLFYGVIEGFQYQEGYEYELQVRVEPVANPPADASSERWVLVDQISKTPALIGATWQWERLVDPQGETIVPDPQQYTLLFQLDGRVAVQADCNRGAGSYTLDDSRLTIGQLTTTLAACLSESLSDQFLQLLQTAATITLDGDSLRMDLMADGGTMFFSRALQLTGVVWQWVNRVDPTKVIPSPDPARYTILFLDSGGVTIQADCNRANGSYTVDGSSLSIGALASTKMACPPESLGDQFLRDLEASAVYFFRDGHLFIDLMADGGTLEFAPEAAAPALIGTLWQWERLTDSVTTIEAPNPQNYTMLLGADGGAALQLDCNRGSGSYQIDGAFLTFGPIATTLMACMPDSLGELFGSRLASAASYRIEGGKLLIELAGDGGVMTFRAAH